MCPSGYLAGDPHISQFPVARKTGSYSECPLSRTLRMPLDLGDQPGPDHTDYVYRRLNLSY